jgi:hypothetical protein
MCATLSILAGCGGPEAQAGLPSLSLSSAPAAVGGQRVRAGSWMAPEAKGQDLLYVSDTSYGLGVVYVYSYPGGKLKGELSGVSPADGLCSDAKGNVFVPAGTSIAEYPHGGTQPIAVLNDPFGGADYCAVDRTTGNLAVSPTVVVYAHAKGKGKAYPGGNEYGNRSCTYDDKGDLFVNGISFVGSLSPRK